LPSLNPALLPNQTILTGFAPRISNTVVGQIADSVTRRTAITFAASYGLLHYQGAGFDNFGQVEILTGVDHALSGRDSIAVIYGGSRIEYSSLGESVLSNSGQIAYARTVTGRLALEASAGPQVWNLTGQPTDRGYHTDWTTTESLKYRLSKTDLSLSYYRGVTGGGGVVVGTTTNVVQANVGRSLTRSLRGNLTVGYAANAYLQGPGSYKSEIFGGTLNHKIGQDTELSFGYTVTHQSTPSTCTGPGCSSSGLRQTASVGFSWDPRPVRVR
jgi:hypothetical protein